ncbi:hypothetical protein [Flagellimonas halotolerans]|uniref:Uncharacterized protein n=1 Tax=Flagellimonas halotolerans TaxID=3112164 RepID=A0ABU6IR88_9FLAO|nr:MULTISPECIES: hypothetical protein [unclassified Allomuricauda]MEC3965714.1 hypothetical protein [Muricauda sp. SYSU M86414]MEC4265581.1 hypothetical protein [Muricauda sp. SYSU M84420]
MNTQNHPLRQSEYKFPREPLSRFKELAFTFRVQWGFIKKLQEMEHIL